MSMVKQIENMIFDYFSDDQVYTTEEFKMMAIEKHIILPDNNTAVRNAIYKLRDNSKFENVGKGKYMVHSKERLRENEFTVEDA